MPDTLLLEESNPNGVLVASKPNYEVGAMMKLPWATTTNDKTSTSSGNQTTTNGGSVWKINDLDEDSKNGEEEDLIDEDDLLDEMDKQKPDPSTLKGINCLPPSSFQFTHYCLV